LDGGDFSDSAWCQARSRLPIELVQQVHRSLIDHARSELDPAEYAVPLGGGFYILHKGSCGNSQPVSTLVVADSDNGSLRTSSGYGWADVVPGVKQLGVTGSYLVGEKRDGYFILDRRPHSDDRQPGGFAFSSFTSAAAWQAALSSAGAGVVRLQTPEALAAGLPDQILRPWNYSVMHGLFGLNDDKWSWVVQIAGISTAFLFGLLPGRRRYLVLFPALLGVVVNFVALAVIAGDVSAGPGFIAFPIIFVVAAKFGSLFSDGGTP